MSLDTYPLTLAGMLLLRPRPSLRMTPLNWALSEGDMDPAVITVELTCEKFPSEYPIRRLVLSPALANLMFDGEVDILLNSGFVRDEGSSSRPSG